jgi:hypothetical protein
LADTVQNQNGNKADTKNQTKQNNKKQSNTNKPKKSTVGGQLISS